MSVAGSKSSGSRNGDPDRCLELRRRVAVPSGARVPIAGIGFLVYGDKSYWTVRDLDR